MIFNRSYTYNDVLTRASITLQVIEDVAIYKAQLFSSNGNIFSSRDESSDLHVRVFKGFEDITDRFTDIIWKRFTAESGSVEEDAKWGEQHKGKKDIVITKDDIQSKANIQVEVYGIIDGKRSLVAVDFITFIDVNDLQGSTTPPTNPNDGDLWLDTSVMPPRLMVWDSNLGMWVEVTIAGNDRRNLIRHSNFYKKNFDYWASVNSPTLSIESLNAKKWARIKSDTIKNAYCGISQITSAISKTQYSFQMLSEIYVQSAYPNGNAVIAFYSVNESNVKTLIKEEKFDLTTDAKVFTSSFTTLVDTKNIEVVISGQKDTQFDFVVTNIKLENHPIPTAWELAIEDMQDALDQKVGNTSEEVFDSLTDNGKMQGLYIDIDEHGNKNYYFKGQFIDAKNLRVMNNNGTRTLYINENGNIEIVASSFTLVAGADTNVPTKDEVKDSIDNIQIGVRNIIKDGGISVTNTNYLIQTYKTHIPLATGKTYTIVFKGSISEGQQFGLWYNGGNASIGRLDRQPGSAVYIKTFTITEVLKTDYLSIYNYPQTTGKPATIEWACLYEGDVKPPLDFVLAPEDMQVGGRNLELNSAPKTNTGWSWAGAAGTAILVDEATAPRGKAMKATFTAEGSSGGMHKPPKERLKVGGIYSWSIWIKASKEMTINLGHEQDGSKEFIVGTEWQRVTYTFRASDRSYNSFVMYARNPKIGDFYLVHSLKLESGNTISDWSAAPEDYDSEIAEAQQNADNANNKINEMSNDNKLTSIEKQSAKLEWDVIAVEKPKIEAEAVKFGIDKTDYVAKYNVLASYLSPLLANLSVTSDIVGDTFRANFKNYYDSRQTLLNAISSKAKDLADNANNKIDNLQIGGNNLISDIRDVVKGTVAIPQYDALTHTWTITATDGEGATWGAGLRIGGNNVVIPYDKNYVVSFEILVPVACEWNVDVNTYPTSGTAWAGNDNDYTNLRQTSTRTLEANKWTKCWYSLVNKHPFNTGLLDIYDNSNFGVRNITGNPMTYQIRKIKGELGNKPTDWSLCQYDIDKAISDANQKAQDALNNLTDLANDNKLTPNEKQQTKKEWDVILGEYLKIISEANKSSVSTTNYTNAYNTLKSYIEPILSNLTTTSDITGVAFRNNFKSYYDNRQDLLNAISTALKANADNANNKIDGLEIGTRNIIINSRNPKSLEFWPYAPSPTDIELIDNDYFGQTEKFFSIKNTTTSERFLGTQRYKLEGGKTYSFSMIVNIENNVTSIDVWLLMKIANSTATDYDVAKQFITGYGKIRNKFHRITGTLTIPDNIVEGYIRIDNNGGAATANRVLFSAVKLEQGTKPSDWSAAPEDIQSDIDNKVDVGGSIDDINQSPGGQIDYPKLNIKGAISFDDLDSEMNKNFIAKKDSQGNRIQTVVNGRSIETGSVTADKMSMYNLNVIRRELVDGVWQERDTSFAITDEGKIRASGTFSSFNYRDDIDISKSEGWMINENGDSVFNSSIVRGRVELPNAGITDYGGGTVYNLLKDTDFRELQEKTDIGWDNALNGTYNLYWWGGYNSGVPDPTHGYHARVDTTTFPFNTLLFRNKNSEINQKNRWLGVNGAISANVLKANVKYTFSIDIYFTAVGQKIYGGLYHKLTDNNTNAFNSGQYTFISTAEHVNKWTRFTYTCTTNAKLSTTNSSNWYIYGYGGTEGDVFINRLKLEEGEVATPYASTADVAKKEVRIYAGTDYYDRYNAPLKILQDGTIIATRGEFGGTFTGRLEIGNIYIYDDLTTPGVIEIKNNDNSKTVVRIGEEYSEFNSDVYIGSKSNYLFRTNLSSKQLVSGKQSSIRFEYEENISGDVLSNSLTVNGKKIQFNQNEFISSTVPGTIEIGTDSVKGNLLIRSKHDNSSDGVDGEMNVSILGSASITTALKLGNVDLMPIYPEGLDIFVN